MRHVGAGTGAALKMAEGGQFDLVLAHAKALEEKFIKEASAKGFSGLKGHRSVGGIRASIYNAFPKKGVEELVTFMDDFKKSN